MTLPADTLRTQRQVVVDYAHVDTVEKYVREGQSQLVLSYDIYVLPRAAFQKPDMPDLLHRFGKRILIEVDDDFTGEHRAVLQEPAYSAFWHAAGKVDAFIVSTDYLGRLMRRKTGKPYYVCPNSVPVERWAKAPKAKHLTIGLTGSNTHGADWSILQDVMPQILRENPQVHFLLAGFCPSYFEKLVQQYSERCHFKPWVPFSEYPEIAGSAQIVLCPVDPNDGFNLAKSGIKAIEGLAAGAAVIATDMNIYREVLTSERHGLLVPYQPDAWYAALTRLVTDDPYRARLSRQGQKHAMKTHNILFNASRWWDAFQSVAQSL